MIKSYLILLFSVPSVLSCYDQNAALHDLSFIQKMIAENHPGSINQSDPSFNEFRFQEEKKRANNITFIKDENSLRSELTEFCKSFHDNHLRICWNHSSSLQLEKQEIVEKRIFESRINEQVAYFCIPTFCITPENEHSIKNIIDTISQVKNKKEIIFDLRGNGGGNSMWGTKILEKLFGDQYATIQIREKNKNCYKEWRASEQNYTYLNSILLQTKHTEETKDFRAFLEKVVSGIKESLERGNPFYKEEELCYSEHDHLVQKHQVTAKITLLIDRGCFSSCLTFIDELQSMNYDKVTLIGEETGADSIYMDTCRVQLPSQKGFFIYPMKVYRNRLRGHNESHKPTIQMAQKEMEDYLNTLKF